MPTGGGKSICFQIPALLQEGLTIVVSPLIALMNDQVQALRQLDIPAGALHSHISSSGKNKIDQQISQGLLKLLYVSPESLLRPAFLEYLKNKSISLFAIDEAHCVSIWGNDFRPEYVKLKMLKEYFPQVPTIALTATADQATQADIVKQLQLSEPKVFLASFERHNIKTTASPGQKRMQQIVGFLRDHPDEPGIIYCLSRKSTEKVASHLQGLGFSCDAYHAGVDSHLRADLQLKFQSDELQIICATIAFGMGIDKPNIRWVIHYNMPKNIEGYYQEIGRGGRDGDPAEALLFYSWADFLNLQSFVDRSDAHETFKNVQRAKLERMWEFATAASCRTNLVLNYFGEYRNHKCNHCDNCISPPKLMDGTRHAQMALSAVIRCGESVGMNMLIDVLRGSYKQEVRAAGFDRIKTFGAGREIPFLDWKHYITQMINQGLLSIDFTDHSKLKRTPLGLPILKNEAKVHLTEFIAQRKSVKTQKAQTDLLPDDVDQGLMARLKSWRLDLARAQGLPAYVILTNKSLEQIAAHKPENATQLLNVDGIGQAKLTKYGDQILAIVAKDT